MRSRNSRTIFLPLCLILVACGSAPQKQNPPTEQAIKLSARADAAFMQGEYERAKNDYHQALRINQSVENAAAIAILRFNLARVFRQMANPDQAHLQLDALLLEPTLSYPSDTLAAAAVLKSQLHLESNEPSLTLSWVEQGARLCQKNCSVAGSLLLLRAQLAQRDQRLDEALKFASDAIAVLKSGMQQVELANAHRVSGEISLATNDFTKAIPSFQQALTIDQKLGIPGKIRLDLLRLGTANERAGAITTALHFYTRALAVSVAMNSAQAADEIRGHIKHMQNDSATKTLESK